MACEHFFDGYQSHLTAMKVLFFQWPESAVLNQATRRHAFPVSCAIYRIHSDPNTEF